MFSDAERSYAMIMRYSRQSQDSEAKSFDPAKLKTQWTTEATTRDPGKWREFVMKNRAAIEADWALLAPQRRWLEVW